MKSKGFTLIELLAVIVILAILAIIAVPIVLNIIDNSKKESVKISAEHYLDAVNNALAKEYLKDPTINLDGRYNIEDQGKKIVEQTNGKEINIEYDGEAVTGGTIVIGDGKVESATNLKINNYYATLESGKLILSKVQEEQEPGTGGLSRASGLYKEDGTYVSWEELINDGTITFSDGVLEYFNGYDQTTWELIIGELVIDASVTSIGSSAFSYSGLTLVEIPNSVTSIGSSAFSSCTNLTQIKVEESNVNYFSGNGVLYNKDKTILLQYPAAKTEGNFTIPSSVTSIGEYAFSSCTSLTSVTIPGSVTNIGDYAFAWVNGLTTVTIEHGVTDIGEGAFYGCWDLASIAIPDSVTSIGRMAFLAAKITSIEIPSSVISIGDKAFGRCTNLKQIIVEENNANYSSENGVLYNKDKTTLIQYPLGATESSFTIPSSVTNIESEAFSESDLESVEIPEGVTSIGYYAFGVCTSLKSITIPSSVTSISDSAFSNCSNLTTVTIKNGVTIIGDDVFDYCVNLTSVTIPDSVISIGEGAFSNCWYLNSITIPDSVTSIDDDAFSGCSLLTATILGSDVTIGATTFNDVPLVYYNGTVPSGKWGAGQVLPLQ